MQPIVKITAFASDVDVCAAPSVRTGWAAGIFGLIAVVAGAVFPAAAQEDTRDFRRPLLVLSPKGHTSPVRALIFTQDGTQLLSAGLDKVVQVWGFPRALGGAGGIDANGVPVWTRTIRPPVWRGLAGAVYAMALSRPDASGQSRLAAGGFGVDNRGGNIRIFQYPGTDHFRTGQPLAVIPSGPPNPPQPALAVGHTVGISALRFDASGRFLASAGLDGLLQIWDVQANPPRHVRTFADHRGPINALGVVAGPNNTRLWLTGGQDGLLRLWDENAPNAPVRTHPNPPIRPDDPSGIRINTLAVSPDNRYVVFGRENGEIVRLDAATLANPQVISRTDAVISALDISADNRHLAVASSRRLRTPGALPDPRSIVEIRPFPENGEPKRVLELTQSIFACRFHPARNALAVAGGDDQSVRILPDVNAPQPVWSVLAGTGTSFYDVGFVPADPATGAGLTIAGMRRRNDLPGAEATGWGFDISSRAIRFVPRDRMRGRVAASAGWTTTTTSPYIIRATGPNGVTREIRLDPVQDGRWWDTSFLPPGPGHDLLTLAVACDAGIAIHRLTDGVRTRFFAGHAGPVTSIAPDPSGRWLLSGSTDQTMRLWTLKSCDISADFGAKFERTGQTWKVSAVTPLGFAQGGGLLVNDQVKKFVIGATDYGLRGEDFLKALPNIRPNTQEVGVMIERREKAAAPGAAPAPPQTLSVGGTLRDAPALTVHMGTNREWVIWTPQGYYDTSIAGDREFLGWHLNPAGPLLAEVTDYAAIARFEALLRQPPGRNPNVIDRLWETADKAVARQTAVNLPAQPAGAGVVANAGADPAPLIRQWQPPRIELFPPAPRGADAAVTLAPQAPGAQPPRIRFRLTSETGGRPITRYRVQVDSRIVREVNVNPPTLRLEQEETLTNFLGEHAFVVTAVNDRDKSRSEALTLIAPPAAQAPPKPAKATSRLVVMSLGVPTFPNTMGKAPSITFADRDATAVAKFLSEHMVAPQGKDPFTKTETLVWADAKVKTSVIRESLTALEDQARAGDLGVGDLLAVFVESHILATSPEGVILTGESGPGPQWSSADSGSGNGTLSANDFADRLGKLAHYGVRVIVFVDGQHAAVRPDFPGNVQEWVRRLQSEQDVVTFVASNQGPSQRIIARRQGAFVLGLLQAVDPGATGRTGRPATAPLSVVAVQDAVRRSVLGLTGNRQYASCYLPESLPPAAPMFRIAPQAVTAPGSN